ncbi:sigma-54-dependent transcriptional regulator [Nevskia soli]|uniref:sigma-54-dependent transcriptional regulator n=1 Tax=Nevskia soli TaxID=418856 RepID=UPI000690BD8C|nr:sigma 54-interacting transcriptional regulator [Nevskia soli]
MNIGDEIDEEWAPDGILELCTSAAQMMLFAASQRLRADREEYFLRWTADLEDIADARLKLAFARSLYDDIETLNDALKNDDENFAFDGLNGDPQVAIGAGLFGASIRYGDVIAPDHVGTGPSEIRKLNLDTCENSDPCPVSMLLKYPELGRFLFKISALLERDRLRDHGDRDGAWPRAKPPSGFGCTEFALGYGAGLSGACVRPDSLDEMPFPTGSSQAIRAARRAIFDAARHDHTVLIVGESGAGKSAVGRLLHAYSMRGDQPFVTFDCAQIRSEEQESMLFGHEKGAFDGATTARRGCVEMAEGGTLFLDEIGEMTWLVQMKVLQLVQERYYSRMGSSDGVRSDVRIIAATQHNLEESVRTGGFSEDLHDQINACTIELPPLRDRPEDLPLLIDDLVSARKSAGASSVTLAPDAVHSLCTYHWPGNVSELAKLINGLAVLYPDRLVTTADLPSRYCGAPVNRSARIMSSVMEDSSETSNEGTSGLLDLEGEIPSSGIDLKDYIESVEISLIRRALYQCNGTVAHAAKLLHTRRLTLVDKLRKYGLHGKSAERIKSSA